MTAPMNNFHPEHSFLLSCDRFNRQGHLKVQTRSNDGMGKELVKCAIFLQANLVSSGLLSLLYAWKRLGWTTRKSVHGRTSP